MKPITYPARPINGGPLAQAPAKTGEWIYEPKYNGWRALIHTPTGAMFNRKGEPLSIRKEFSPALDALQTLHADNGCDARSLPFPEWVDCEALERRHAIGRGTLFVLDFIPPAAQRQMPYSERRAHLIEWLGGPLFYGSRPCADYLHVCDSFTEGGALSHWYQLQEVNKTFGCDFYEGMVAKKADSPYPIQLLSPDREFPGWIKHRWRW